MPTQGKLLMSRLFSSMQFSNILLSIVSKAAEKSSITKSTNLSFTTAYVYLDVSLLRGSFVCVLTPETIGRLLGFFYSIDRDGYYKISIHCFFQFRYH